MHLVMCFLVSKSEVKTLVTVLLTGSDISLVLNLLLWRHGVPNLSLLLVEVNKVGTLHHEGGQTNCKNGNADSVSSLVVRSIPLSVNLATNKTSTDEAVSKVNQGWKTGSGLLTFGQ